MAVKKSGYIIIERAVSLRLKKGEKLENILNAYPGLSEAQVEELKKKSSNEE